MKFHELEQDEYCYTIGPYNKPVLEVKPDDTVVVDTPDCSGNKVKTEKDYLIPPLVTFPYANPLCGPIYVEGANKGDTLAIQIKSIKPSFRGKDLTQAWTGLVPGAGTAVGTFYTRMMNPDLPPKTYICPIKDGKVHFPVTVKSVRKEMVIPIRPFYGTIGIAPEIDAISSIIPGQHGGNMDARDVCVGNTLYLPVFVDGALLHIGDAHLAQGDGELCGTAIETAARGILTINLIKGRTINWPRIESPTHIMTVGSCRPLIDALRIAVVEMVGWLEAEYGFDSIDAYQSLSVLGEAVVGNSVNPNYSMVVRFPKRYINQLV